MYAIIRDGGKQYRVREGEMVDLELKDVPVGQTIELREILMVSDENGDVKVGSPTIDGAYAVGTVVMQFKAKKIRIIKYKRRKGYRRKKGHRQRYTRVRIDKIYVPGASAGEAEPAEAAEQTAGGTDQAQ